MSVQNCLLKAFISPDRHVHVYTHTYIHVVLLCVNMWVLRVVHPWCRSHYVVTVVCWTFTVFVSAMMLDWRRASSISLCNSQREKLRGLIDGTLKEIFHTLRPWSSFLRRDRQPGLCRGASHSIVAHHDICVQHTKDSDISTSSCGAHRVIADHGVHTDSCVTF